MNPILNNKPCRFQQSLSYLVTRGMIDINPYWSNLRHGTLHSKLWIGLPTTSTKLPIKYLFDIAKYRCCCDSKEGSLSAIQQVGRQAALIDFYGTQFPFRLQMLGNMSMRQALLKQGMLQVRLCLRFVILLLSVRSLKPVNSWAIETYGYQLLLSIYQHNQSAQKQSIRPFILFYSIFCCLKIEIQYLNLMSVDDSQEEDCTVYIEELKSDNPSLKLNAATKISVIGAVLGHNRIKQELIPYLIEIIEQMDNDNQFLIKVCEGILELKQFCKTPEELSSLIYPLRVLASLDQPPVRDQATQCLKKLAVGQTKQFYQKHYFPLITSMGKKTGPYSPKVTACCLLPVAYPCVSEKSQGEFRALFKTFALEENSPLVRRAVAENIEAFANVVDKKIIRSDFFQIWQSLIVDTFDIIRIKALQCAVIVARAFKKEETTDKFFKLIRFVDSGKKSWRVRYSLVECLASILNYLEKDIVKKDVVQAFQELLKDQQAQVRAISIIKLPALTQKLSQSQAFSVFFQYFQKFAKDANKQSTPTVKLAVVQAIIPYFRTIEKQKLFESGIPILGVLLKDQNQSIRIGIMQKIMDITEMINRQQIIKYLIPLIEGCLTDKKWRFKLAIAESLINFFKSLPFEEHREFYQKIINNFLKDHNFAVREQTIKSIVQSKDVLGYSKYLQICQKFINQLIGDTNYIYRVTAGIFLMNLKGLDKSHASQLFSSLCKKIENEKISNVLVAFFMAYGKIKGSLTPQVKKQFQGLLSKVKEEKQDEDVLYYAAKCEQ